jgi:hypothetical protein
MLRMFGLGEGEKLELGWGQETASDASPANVSFHTFQHVCLHRVYVSGKKFCFRIFSPFPHLGMVSDNWPLPKEMAP